MAEGCPSVRGVHRDGALRPPTPHDPSDLKAAPVSKSSLKEKVVKIVQSATDTEGGRDWIGN